MLTLHRAISKIHREKRETIVPLTIPLINHIQSDTIKIGFNLSKGLVFCISYRHHHAIRPHPATYITRAFPNDETDIILPTSDLLNSFNLSPFVITGVLKT